MGQVLVYNVLKKLKNKDPTTFIASI